MERYEIAQQIQQKYLIKQNFVVKKAFTYKYLRYRILRPILKLYNRYLVSRFENPPWTSPASIEIFGKLLTNKMNGLEYGSGKSTLFFARKLKYLVSIEHYSEWYNKVLLILKENKIKNVDYFFIPENESMVEPRNLSDQLQGFPPEIKIKENFRDYFRKVNSFDDEFFDFILIDGRARVECLLNAVPKLKKGGILVLDNSERKRYTQIHEILQTWKSINTTTGLTDTTFWFKPEWE